LRVDTVLPVWQDGATMSGTQNQFSLTRAAAMKERRLKEEIPIFFLDFDPKAEEYLDKRARRPYR
jgi:hypothetical protein